MKSLLLIFCFLCFAGSSSGQELPDYAIITEVKVKADTLHVKGFEKQTKMFLESKKCIEGNFVYTNRVFKWFPTV